MSEENTKENAQESIQENEETNAHSTPNYEDLYKRALADLVNQTKTFKIQMDDAVKFANKKIITDLVAITDIFNLALSYNPEDQGIKMLQEEFLKVLTKNGVTQINPIKGDNFDPNVHQAISVQAASDLEDNKIFSVMQSGYELNGRILKAAKVIVVKN